MKLAWSTRRGTALHAGFGRLLTRTRALGRLALARELRALGGLGVTPVEESIVLAAADEPRDLGAALQSRHLGQREFPGALLGVDVVG